MHRVALGDVTARLVSLNTSRLLAAYRRWIGLAPLETTTGAPWVFEPVAFHRANVAKALTLRSMVIWAPDDTYWGEEGTDVDPLYMQIIAAGQRSIFEMEQVLPGFDEDDWGDDPIVRAADLHAAGYRGEATGLLESLISQDERCIDAWVHLGNFAFRHKGPKAAFEFYDVAVSIGEQSLPSDFDGVLPRGLVDNRPFHRALHGAGLCAWRQRGWAAAEVTFTNLLWIDGCQTWDSLECLTAVQARQPWRAE